MLAVVDAVLEMGRLGLRTLELVRRRRDVPISEPLGLTGSAPAKDVPAAVELGLHRLQPRPVIRGELPTGVGAPKDVLLVDQLFDPTTDRLLVHGPRVLPVLGRAGVAAGGRPQQVSSPAGRVDRRCRAEWCPAVKSGVARHVENANEEPS